MQGMYSRQLQELWTLMKNKLIIGTRGSQLAVWQAEWVRSELMVQHPSLTVELEIIKTKGDKILDVPLAKVGGKGLFIKEIEEALLEGRVDLAVHSMKDMPAEIPTGLCIGAIPERETPKDALISRNGLSFLQLPHGARIGTSSLRRGAQLKHMRPDVQIRSLRGNVGTRLEKLESDRLDAIILAAAGIKRLGFENRITEYLDEDIMLPAVGQGALCIECRENDPDVHPLIEFLDDSLTRSAVLGERAFLKRLEGGCQVPIAGHGTVVNGKFSLCGLVAEIDGSTVIKQTISGSWTESETLGLELANRLLAKGAKEILDKLNTDGC